MSSGWQKGSGARPAGSNAQILANALAALESENNLPLIRAAGHLRQTVGLPVSGKVQGLIADASKSILDDGLPATVRAEGLQLLALADFNDREDILFRLLDNRQPLVLQKIALSQLASEKHPRVGKRLLELWPGLTPDARKVAGDVLERSSDIAVLQAEIFRRHRREAANVKILIE